MIKISKLENTGFDFNDAVTDIMNGKSIGGKDGVFSGNKIGNMDLNIKKDRCKKR